MSLGDDRPAGPLGEGVPVVILTEDDRLVSAIAGRCGEEVRVLWNGIMTGRLRPEALAEIGRVAHVELLRLHEPLLDRALPTVGFQQTVPGGLELPGYPDLDGRGTLIAIIDTGFDLNHPCFRDRNGRLRVRALLVQEKTGQQTVYTHDALARSWNPGGTGPGSDPDGHGTHVASIAGGSPFCGLRGVAPGAEFLLVRTNLVDLPEAFEWVRMQAQAAGMPMAVNLSLGHHYGAHDGSSPEESEILAPLTAPGIVVVAAAGNSRGCKQHCRRRLEPREEVAFPFQWMPADPENRFRKIAAWYSLADHLEVELVTPDGQRLRFAPPGPGTPSQSGWLCGVRITCGSRSNEDTNQLAEVSAELHLLTAFPPNCLRGWQLRFRAGDQVVDGQVDAWIVAGGMGEFEENPALEDAGTLTIPGTSPHCLTVASYVSSADWHSGGERHVDPDAQPGRISRFSSLGPTLRGSEDKPEIAAPGEWITAALSAQASHKLEVRKMDPPRRAYTSRGTSMATPIVTGLVALMMQQRRDLTVSEVRNKIRESALRDAWTGDGAWTPEYGAGKVNALGAIRLASSA